MKRLISTLFVVFAVLMAMNAQEQPLLKTHVIKLFLTQLRQWAISVGAILSQQSLGRV